VAIYHAKPITVTEKKESALMSTLTDLERIEAIERRVRTLEEYVNRLQDATMTSQHALLTVMEKLAGTNITEDKNGEQGVSEG
jgi:hypothetical protein